MKLYESGEYRSTKNWPYAISAGCVVYRDTDRGIEVLLLVRKAGDYPGLSSGHADSYHLPKGHIGLDETLEQAASRETAEEAGVEADIQTYLGARRHRYEDRVKVDKIIHYFAARWQRDLSARDNEHSEILWASVEEAERLLSSTGSEPNPKAEHEMIERLVKFFGERS